MQLLSRLSVVALAGFAVSACGGSPAPTSETTPGETEYEGDSSTADVAASSGGADSASQLAGETVGAGGSQGGSQGASGPDAGDDCMAFHVKMVECEKAAGEVGASEEAEMRGAARDGCPDAYADRDNPVTSYIIELWSKCGRLSCAEIEDCFLSGMTQLGAPPGPASLAPH